MNKSLKEFLLWYSIFYCWKKCIYADVDWVIRHVLFLNFCFLFTVFLAAEGQDIPVFFFSKNPQSKDVVEGTETRLQCDVSDRTHIRFHWTLDGKPLTNTSRRFQEDSNLRILRVLRGEDEGAFRCIATTNVPTAYSIVSQEASLNIQCK